MTRAARLLVLLCAVATAGCIPLPLPDSDAKMTAARRLAAMDPAAAKAELAALPVDAVAELLDAAWRHHHSIRKLNDLVVARGLPLAQELRARADHEQTYVYMSEMLDVFVAMHDGGQLSAADLRGLELDGVCAAVNMPDFAPCARPLAYLRVAAAGALATRADVLPDGPRTGQGITLVPAGSGFCRDAGAAPVCIEWAVVTQPQTRLIARGDATGVDYVFHEVYADGHYVPLLRILPVLPAADGRWDPLESTCRHASLSIL